ncbi:NUDIX hydrolase [Haliangium ochraceum]|uniref:NUDIX hydrolase n=1 Tax=Haliangium ochraceum (strain DSM 14365 / JCM 11303 / SMP-2) TaxID=502025 RepID=D0LKE9_HALO1|nr:CoA pyrophosphatase [Haliangium ochraceum]ACY14997.1 NUDIX hydrolase [Haliangium ochraceum DSM 14365]
MSREQVPPLSLARFEARLATVREHDPSIEGVRTAVAMLLRFGELGPEVLLMKRAERADDHWSGHISLPGGREQDGDRDLRATAMRETEEEVGVSLARDARPIGRLAAIQAVARGRIIPMVVAPFVFVETQPVRVALGPEAQDAFWLPLREAAAGAFSDIYLYDHEGATRELPCWRYRGHTVWGLTYRMLDDLLRLVGER